MAPGSSPPTTAPGSSKPPGPLTFDDLPKDLVPPQPLPSCQWIIDNVVKANPANTMNSGGCNTTGAEFGWLWRKGGTNEFTINCPPDWETLEIDNKAQPLYKDGRACLPQTEIVRFPPSSMPPTFSPSATYMTPSSFAPAYSSPSVRVA